MTDENIATSIEAPVIEAPTETSVSQSLPESAPQQSADIVTPDQKESDALSHGTSLLSSITEKEQTEKETPAIEPDKEESDDLKTVEENIESPEPITYEKFNLPEGLEIPKQQLDEFTKVIGDHRLPQEAAQRLVDMHLDAIKSISQKSLEDQWSVFHNQQKEWTNEVMSDPVLGGSGHKTAMALAAKGIDAVVSADDRKEFNEALSVTGAGNHKAIIKAFYRVGKLLGEPQQITSAIKPPPDRGSEPVDKFSNIYTHPTSKRK